MNEINSVSSGNGEPAKGCILMHPELIPPITDKDIEQAMFSEGWMFKQQAS